MSSIKKNYFLLALILFSGTAYTQIQPKSSVTTITVVAGKEYEKTRFYQWLWGKNRRKEWTTPVSVPVVLLDTLMGGLLPYQKGGGNESKSLRLKSTSGKEYVLRSVNKTRKNATPKLLKKTYFAKLIQDGVSMSYPYSAIALPLMLEHAGILHAKPKLVYIPQHSALDSFNNLFANDLYQLEERPDGNWSDAKHLGNYTKFASTAKVKETLRDDNKYKADQFAFIKARLFDILISDVDRHHDNWRWGIADDKSFKPIPRDRDQAFFTHDGLLTGILIPLTRFRFMQSFDYTIKNVRKLTLTKRERTLDNFFTNEMSYNDWIKAAAILRKSLTDSIITASIKKLPPEVFSISGNEIIDKLKQRRNNMEYYAARYYYAMAKKVEINGSIQQEHFEIKKQSNKEVSIKIFRLNSSGHKDNTPYYNRIFNAKETKLITINSFGGSDVFDKDKELYGIKITINKSL